MDRDQQILRDLLEKADDGVEAVLSVPVETLQQVLAATHASHVTVSRRWLQGLLDEGGDLRLSPDWLDPIGLGSQDILEWDGWDEGPQEELLGLSEGNSASPNDGEKVEGKEKVDEDAAQGPVVEHEPLNATLNSGQMQMRMYHSRSLSGVVQPGSVILVQNVAGFALYGFLFLDENWKPLLQNGKAKASGRVKELTYLNTPRSFAVLKRIICHSQKASIRVYKVIRLVDASKHTNDALAYTQPHVEFYVKPQKSLPTRDQIVRSFWSAARSGTRTDAEKDREDKEYKALAFDTETGKWGFVWWPDATATTATTGREPALKKIKVARRQGSDGTAGILAHVANAEWWHVAVPSVFILLLALIIGRFVKDYVF